MTEPRPVAVIGLGSMGLGMAQSLLAAGFSVRGCDPDPAARSALKTAGGYVFDSASTAVHGCDIVVCVVVNAAQTRAVIDDIAPQMPAGSVFISCATMKAEDAVTMANTLAAQGVHYLDAPISGGSIKAASGDLSIMAAGSPAAFACAEPALNAMAAQVYRLGDQVGKGASVKMINQLLAGVHIAAACEAMALAAKLDLDLETVYEVITGSAGNSWMFENRVPHILAGDYAPRSMVDIFVKDMGIVQDITRSERFPAPISAAALQMYLAASGAGMGRDDDASLARLYAQLSGTQLPKGKA